VKSDIPARPDADIRPFEAFLQTLRYRHQREDGNAAYQMFLA